MFLSHMDISPSLSLPSSLKSIHIFKNFKKHNKTNQVGKRKLFLVQTGPRP